MRFKHVYGWITDVLLFYFWWWETSSVILVTFKIIRTSPGPRSGQQRGAVHMDMKDRNCLVKTFTFHLSSQNAMVSFKELCGLTPAANMKQCILTVSTWLMNSERSLRVTVDLSETYPTMEAQGPVPELLRKVLNAYDMVSKASVHLTLDWLRVLLKPKYP